MYVYIYMYVVSTYCKLVVLKLGLGGFESGTLIIIQ